MLAEVRKQVPSGGQALITQKSCQYNLRMF